jgi:hypothetical protein
MLRDSQSWMICVYFTLFMPANSATRSEARGRHSRAGGTHQALRRADSDGAIHPNYLSECGIPENTASA